MLLSFVNAQSSKMFAKVQIMVVEIDIAFELSKELKSPNSSDTDT